MTQSKIYVVSPRVDFCEICNEKRIFSLQLVNTAVSYTPNLGTPTVSIKNLKGEVVFFHLELNLKNIRSMRRYDDMKKALTTMYAR